MTNQRNGGSTSDDRANTGRNARWTLAAQRHYDPETGPELTTVVVSAVAEAGDAPLRAVKLPPLYERFDVSTLEDAFFDGVLGDAGTERDVLGDAGAEREFVQFRYGASRVRIRRDGWVQVYEPTDCETP